MRVIVSRQERHRNATAHINIFASVYVRVSVVVSRGGKRTERPLLDLCVTNGVRYKCTMTGQNNTVLLGKATATYNPA